MLLHHSVCLFKSCAPHQVRSTQKFQLTRGVLRLMAQVIHELWMANDPSVVIMPSNVIVSSPRVEPELLHYLDISWQAIIAGDVDGENSTPYKIDQAAPNLDRYSATRRVARTLFMGSAPTYQQQNSGLDDKRINLGARTMNRLRGDVSVLAENGRAILPH